jgi:hypothetical protein
VPHIPGASSGSIPERIAPIDRPDRVTVTVEEIRRAVMFYRVRQQRPDRRPDVA